MTNSIHLDKSAPPKQVGILYCSEDVEVRRFIKLPIVHWTVPHEGEAQEVPLVSWLPYQVEASNVSYRSKGVFENFRINDLVQNQKVMNYLLTFQNWLALFFMVTLQEYLTN